MHDECKSCRGLFADCHARHRDANAAAERPHVVIRRKQHREVEHELPEEVGERVVS
jgi:hypothetical protein